MGREVGVLRVADDGTILAASAEAEAALGVCVGRRCADVVGARARDDAPLCTGACAGALATGEATHLDRTVVLSSGHIGRLTCTRVGEESVVVVQATSRTARAYPRPLTPREREVLELVGLGMTNREVADALGLRPATVRTHVEHALDKLGAVTRAEAVSAARELGELP